MNQEQQQIVRGELENQIDQDDTVAAKESPAKKAKEDSAMNFLLGTLSDDTQAITTGFDEIHHFIKEPSLDPDAKCSGMVAEKS